MSDKGVGYSVTRTEFCSAVKQGYSICVAFYESQSRDDDLLWMKGVTLPEKEPASSHSTGEDETFVRKVVAKLVHLYTCEFDITCMEFRSQSGTIKLKFDVMQRLVRNPSPPSCFFFQAVFH